MGKLIDNWSVTFTFDDPYRPPEAREVSLQGWLGKRRVITSQIASIKGRFITTRSGSVYRLGRIDPAYRRYLRKHRPSWDWRNPIVLV